MNLKELFDMQRALDDAIMKTHNKLPGDVVNERKIALLVEISEFANEIATFKYWKKNKKINRKDSLEEFVDGIHFFISLGFQVELEPIIESKIISEDANIQLLEVFKTSTALIEDLNKTNLKIAFEIYIGLGAIMSFTKEEIFESYIDKNKTNFDRIKNNY